MSTSHRLLKESRLRFIIHHSFIHLSSASLSCSHFEIIVFISVVLSIQIGSYFGSEVCVVDVDQDGITDILLIAAPMFLGAGNKETGKVYVYCLDGVRSKKGKRGHSLNSFHSYYSLFRIPHFLRSLNSLHRMVLPQTGPYILSRKPRMLGLVTPWLWLQISTMMAFLTF